MDSKTLISFGIVFIVIFLVHLLFITRPAILKITNKKETKKGRRPKRIKTLGQIDYLCKKFKLDKDKLNYKELMIMIPLIDSFIITLVTLIIDLIPLPFIINLVIGFVLLTGLIYSMYEIYGKHLLKKEKEK